MILTLALSVTLGAPADEIKKTAPPNSKQLFAKEEWYKSQEGKEKTFEGVLRYAPREEGVVGFGRYNPFTLTLANPEGNLKAREVYVGAKDELLKAYAGLKVRITGKTVDMEVEGRMHYEIWPAQIELIKGAPEQPKEKPMKDGTPVKIVGRTTWRASTKPGAAAQQLVIRNAEEFAQAAGAANDPKPLLDHLAKQFKVDAIDWRQHMLIVVTGGAQRTGGYRLEIQEISTKDSVMTVRWKLHEPRPTDFVTMAFSHPAETVLVDRFVGKVRFDPPAPAGEKPANRRGIDDQKKRDP